MKKIIFSMLVLIFWTISLSAQKITRAEADEIVTDYVKNEVEHPDQCLLYGSPYFSFREGVTVTTSNDEVLKAEYACWVYFLDENPQSNEPSQNRYLFVSEEDGYLLEVIVHNDTGPDDSIRWPFVYILSGLIDVENNTLQSPYSNPVGDWLTIPCTEELTRVEIHDLKGMQLFSGWLPEKNACQLNVSFLKAGIYIVSVYRKSNKENYKIVKN